MTIQIQNMVCPSCTILLQERLANVGFTPQGVRIGEVDFSVYLSAQEMVQFDEVLKSLGFTRLQGRRSEVLGQLKQAALDWVSGGQASSPYTWSHYVSQRLGLDYSHLSHLFSEETRTTLEGFIIGLRVEKAKEHLKDKQQSLTDIANLLGYSSLPHFSAQFKKETGQTPSDYRKNPVPPSMLREFMAGY